MIRRIWAVFLVFIVSSAALAQQAVDISPVMSAIRAQNWSEAARVARSYGPVAQDIVEWHRLRAGEGSWRDAQGFLRRRPDWPGLPLLRRKQEPNFADAPAEAVFQVFAQSGAQTAAGALALADALRARGLRDEAHATVTQAWLERAMSDEEHAAYLARYGDVLKSRHVDRLDAMLWKGWRDNSQRMYPLVPDGWRKLAAARLALREDRTGVDVFIDAVPSRLVNDPGLAYERFLWRARKGRNDEAIELILQRSSQRTLGNADAWASRRLSLARTEMRAGRAAQAYQIASQHGLTDGSTFAQLEWLAGYIALRYLNENWLALQHFVFFEQAVQTPISLARAGYWIGRAFEALGDEASAQRAYAGGGAYQTTFYGLLAAEKAGLPIDQSLSGRSSVPNWRGAAFARSSVHEAAMLFYASGEGALAERFWVHLAETQDVLEMAQMGAMALDLGDPHIAVKLGKYFASQGIEIHAPYYPLHPLMNRTDLPVPTELALAIARRESEFDPSVISHANAYGLMQILPSTAKLVAGALGVRYDKAKLLSDADYNVTLGTAYLDGLSDEFDGNIIMVSAGYNAGPRRPSAWMAEMGDPRQPGGPDIVDWIEHIPFTETRNYVMRVSESLPIYRARLGKAPLPVPFSQEISGRSLAN
ncbi:lytic transglycosylase domain-containing protein [Cognatishimia sp.]|uniref:lytic transglycosylase domain-containing protein n=1 Tax=Cognatishimia sp. TaxID=2211648 RepID=UPI003519BC31